MLCYDDVAGVSHSRRCHIPVGHICCGRDCTRTKQRLETNLGHRNGSLNGSLGGPLRVLSVLNRRQFLEIGTIKESKGEQILPADERRGLEAVRVKSVSTFR